MVARMKPAGLDVDEVAEMNTSATDLQIALFYVFCTCILTISWVGWSTTDLDANDGYGDSLTMRSILS